MMVSTEDGLATAGEPSEGDKSAKERPAAREKSPPKEKAAAVPKPLLTMDDEEPADKPHPLKEKGGELKTLQPAASDQGYLVANTQPWAKVIIDGKDTGKTTPIAPRSKIPLKPGKHVVTFVANGKKFNFDVNIKSNEDTRLIKQLTDSGP